MKSDPIRTEIRVEIARSKISANVRISRFVSRSVVKSSRYATETRAFARR